MQEQLNLGKIKELLFPARQQINNMLNLNRTKKIKFEESQYFDLLSFMSLFNTCAENSSQVMNEMDNIPSGDSFLEQLKKLLFEEAECQFQNIFEKQLKKMFPRIKKGKKLKKSTLIFDLHEQETYAKNRKTNKTTKGGKNKNGTNYFFKYLTMQIMHKNKIMTLSIKFYTKEEKLPELLDDIIVYAKQFVDIKLVLFDRGFRDVKIINNMVYRNAPILMPAVMDDKCKNEFVRLANKSFAKVKYSLMNPENEFADVTLIMIKLSNGKEIGFFTTMFTLFKTSKFFLKNYAKRWNIETGYRLQNMLLAKTTSQNKVIRFFYFAYAVAMHNLWLLLTSMKNIGKHFTLLKMKLVLILSWITTHLPYDW